MRFPGLRKFFHFCVRRFGPEVSEAKFSSAQGEDTQEKLAAGMYWSVARKASEIL